MTSIFVRLSDVTKRHDGGGGVEGVSLDINAGESIVLLGPSGSGKTTLLRLIAGLETPERGSIWIDEQCVADRCRNTVRSHQRHVGLVFKIWLCGHTSPFVKTWISSQPRWSCQSGSVRHVFSKRWHSVGLISRSWAGIRTSYRGRTATRGSCSCARGISAGPSTNHFQVWILSFGRVARRTRRLAAATPPDDGLRHADSEDAQAGQPNSSHCARE
jgi:hypothetical protein